ncbi:pyridine nucleotide-disulfide [Colletotrichum higginsianum]|nr:pyridine nucleotide-disulfide [Colletotrichum higginsianum]
MSKPVLVIIGTGWGGFTLTQKVSLEKYDVKVISPIRTIQYTPLLASAACGLFNFRLAEEPVRRKHRTDQDYYKAIAEDIDFEKRIVRCKTDAPTANEDPTYFEVRYDKICIAPGCETQDFGTPGAKEHALFLKTTNDARLIQQRILQMLDKASLPTTSEHDQRDYLNIRIVGGGAIGIEAAAELWDLWFEDMRFLFPHLDGKLNITIHDVAPKILSTFDASLSEYATSSLEGKHVKLMTGSNIQRVEDDAIFTKEDGRLPYGLLIWATGNKVNPLVDSEETRERATPYPHRQVPPGPAPGREPNGQRLRTGDAADIEGESLPTLAEVALQKGEYLTVVLNSNGEPAPFNYKQRALLAYLGRRDGIIGGRKEWTGVSAWLAWRSGSLGWTRSWRRKIMISISWIFIWIAGRDIARP